MDRQNFSITTLTDVTVSVPRFRVEWEDYDSETGEIIADHTGANAITFPNALASLDAEQKKRFRHMVLEFLIQELT